ncbi:DUF4192 domain-containing protein [Ornithinimicrobium cerasi]|uniref:DUF4192 domain-containing protein n=1 Tax=Ornithinimicrobium cerasi TaxID=2248773 RepID=UPI000F00AF21|nr:DUF4192 domain-containing protein [Ornithinimicrobium cerasi]
MTTHQTSQTLLRGAAQLLAGIPYLLDYRPERSLVLVGSVVERARLAREARPRLPVSVLLRVDLPAAGEADSLAAQLAAPVGRVVRDRGQGLVDPLLLVHLFLLDATDDEATALLAACREHLAPAGAELHSVLLVRDGLFRSLLPQECPPDCDTDEHRLPTGWQPVPDPADVPGVADLVLEGRNPSRRREDVVARVRARDERSAGLTTVALGVLDLDPSRLDRVEAVGVLGRWVCGGGQLPDPRERAAIARTTEDRWVRDLLLGRWLPDVFPLAGLQLTPEDRRLLGALPPLPTETGDCVERLLDLARAVPAPLTPALLTLVGCLAWRHGEGTVANEAIDLALEVDPDYRMAQLLQRVLVHGISPWAMRTAAAA